MIIPVEALAPDILRALVEEFITREGTDYGQHEVALDTKVDQVINQMRRGEVLILFDSASESTTLMPRQDVPPELLQPGDG